VVIGEERRTEHESCRTTLIEQLKRFTPVFAWAALISIASTDSLSDAHTLKIAFPLFRFLLPNASLQTLEWLQFVIRKCAHIAEYFIFGLLLFRALRGEHRGWTLRWAVLAIAIAAGYSALDEFHQSFVPSRTASPWDSLLDTSAAAIAQVKAWTVLKTR
jgi:VanZ family protein